MGTSPSKTSPLAPTFKRMATWDLKASRGLLQTYKEKDMDFGLDSQGLAELLGGDKDWAENIVDAFRSTSGMYVESTNSSARGTLSSMPFVVSMRWRL